MSNVIELTSCHFVIILNEKEEKQLENIYKKRGTNRVKVLRRLLGSGLYYASERSGVPLSFH